MPSLRLCACLLLVIGLTGPTAAQPQPARIILDIAATAADGTPVTTLQPSDLALRVNGRAQAVTGLTLVRHQAETASPVPAPYATNQAATGRTIALAVDITRVPAARTSAWTAGVANLLSELHARDRVALVALALDGFALDFTTRHDRIRAIAAALKPRVTEPVPAREAETAAVTSLGLLQRLVTGLSVEPGHKTIVFVTAPFATSKNIQRAIEGVATAAASQRVQLVIINLGTVATPSTGLATLAAATGAVLLPAGDPAAFASAAASSTTRYELTFTPGSGLDPDKPHRVQVVSLRPGVHVTAPASIVIPGPGAASEGMVPLADMLRQPRVYRDLPLRLAVYPVRDTDGDRLRLLILGESEDPARTLAWVEFALVAPSGAVVSQWKVDGADAAARPLFTAALAPEGAYRLRMAASELSGRRGTVDVEFDARLTPAGAFALGPMMFGAMSTDAFVPQLQPAASATAIMAYAEIYGRPEPADTWTASIEVARTTDGPAISTAPASVRTTPDPLRRAALGTLDLTALTPGDYVVRVIISRNGAEIGRVTRTLRKAVQ